MSASEEGIHSCYFIIKQCENVRFSGLTHWYEFPLGFQGVNPLRRVDFLSFEKLEFAEMMLSKFPQFSTEQLNNFWRPLSRKMLIFWVV